ncbi:MAG: hypothetical protein ABIK65_09610 [Candidatus Eisenbacteria bacterium]
MIDRQRNGGGGPDEEDVDPGEPIAELAGLGEEAPEDFFGRVVRSVERRVFAAHAFDLPWFGFNQVFREYWSLLVGLFLGRDGTEGDS